MSESVNWISKNGGEDEAEKFFNSAISNMLNIVKENDLMQKSKEEEEETEVVTEVASEEVVEDVVSEEVESTDEVVEEIVEEVEETVIASEKMMKDIADMVMATVLKSLEEYHTQAILPLTEQVETMSENLRVVKAKQADATPLFDLSPPTAIAEMVKQRFSKKAESGDVVVKDTDLEQMEEDDLVVNESPDVKNVSENMLAGL